MSNKPKAYRNAQRKKDDKKSMKQFYTIAIIVTLVAMIIFYFSFMG